MRFFFVALIVVIVFTSASYSYRRLFWRSSVLPGSGLGTIDDDEFRPKRDPYYEPYQPRMGENLVVPPWRVSLGPAGRRLGDSGLISCGNGKTFMPSWICDGDDDCDNGYEERNCEELRRSFETEVTSRNPFQYGFQSRIEEDDDDDEIADDTDNQEAAREAARERIRMVLLKLHQRQDLSSAQNDEQLEDQNEITDDTDNQEAAREAARERIRMILLRVLQRQQSPSPAQNEQLVGNRGNNVFMKLVITKMQIQMSNGLPLPEDQDDNNNLIL